MKSRGIDSAVRVSVPRHLIGLGLVEVSKTAAVKIVPFVTPNPMFEPRPENGG
jgi:hypothetical protein